MLSLFRLLLMLKVEVIIENEVVISPFQRQILLKLRIPSGMITDHQ